MAARQEQEIMDIFNRLIGNASGTMDPAANYYKTILGMGTGAMEQNATLTPAALAFMSEELEAKRGQINAGYFNTQIPQEMRDFLSRTGGSMGTMEDIIAKAGVTPESAALRKQLGTVLGGQTPEMQTLSSVAQAMMAMGGYTGGMKDIQQALSPLLANQGFSKELLGMQGKGSDILSAGGRTSESTAISGMLQQMIGAGGWDPQAMTSFLQGQGMFSTGGMTPELRQLLSSVLPLIQSGGKGGALLPMEQMTAFARDAAATASAQRAQAARRSAFQRMGGAVGAGTSEQALAEFADESARGEAEAVRGAATSQQGLQLQQLLGAMGIGSDISKSATTNIGTGAQLMQAAQAAAAGRYGSSVSGFSNIFQSETDRMRMAGELVTMANQLANQRFLGATGGLTNIEELATTNRGQASTDLINYINAQLAAGKDISGILGIEAGRQNTATQGLTDLSDIFRTTYQGQQEFDLKQKTTSIASFLQTMQQQLDAYNAFYGNMNTAAAGLTNIGGVLMQPTGSALSAFGNISAQDVQNSANPIWSQLVGNILGGAAGGAGTGLGTVIGRIGIPKVGTPGG